MMMKRNVKLIVPAGAIRNIASLIVQLFVGMFTLLLLIYF
jgi:hypothetical protein